MSRAPAVFLLSWSLAAGFAVLLERETAASAPPEAPSGVRRLLGGFTETLGDTLFIKANDYYHGGAAAGARSAESAETYAREGHIAEAPAAPDWIARTNALIAEHSHYHLERGEREEMLPLLKFALALDPRNAEAVLTTAFWLERLEGKDGQALAVLERGAADNPGSWEIAFRLAKTLFAKGDHAAAKRRYEDTLRLLGDAQDAHNYVRRDALYALGLCHAALGERALAKASYVKALGYFAPGEAAKLRGAVEAELERVS